MLSLLCALAILQQPVVGPEIPFGASRPFQEACLAVEEALEKREFTQAEKLVAALPSLQFAIEWDDSAVPANRRAEFAKARDAAIDEWSKEVSGLKVTIAKQGRVKIAFAPELPPNADSPGPAGAVFFVGFAPDEPAVDAVIALTRTESRFSVDAKDVTNEVAFAIGSYLGLERLPNVGSVMSRHEQPYRMINRITTIEGVQVRDNMKVVEALKGLVVKRVQVRPARPEIFLSQTEFAPDPVVQGDNLAMSVTVTNRGTATLRYRLIPDCSCFALAYDREVKPGDSRLIQIVVDTIRFTGDLVKTIGVHSNDPTANVRKLDFTMRIDPLYAFFGMEGQRVLYADETPEGEVFFVPHPKRPLKPTGVELEGLSGTATLEPWSGTLPGQNGKTAEGYRIRFKLTGDIPSGRAGLGFNIKTDNPDWSPVRHSIYVQKGIVALPTSVYMGEIGKEPQRAWTLISGPGKPYKILRVESDSKYFEGLVEASSHTGEYKLIVQYKGGADFGDLTGTLRVVLDDPKQKEVVVPVRAVVRG